jgi:hypothetical protein
MISWIIASTYSLGLAVIFKWTIFQMVVVACLFAICLETRRGN